MRIQMATMLIPITYEGENIWVTPAQLLALWTGAQEIDGVIYLPGEFTKFEGWEQVQNGDDKPTE